jgi:DEAD/DEAH box helicase domain-containing protein
MSASGGPADADSAAWTEVRALCDEAFHPLIDALVAAEMPGPDHIGDDLIADGRVVGTMEFGWSGTRVGVIEEPCEVTGWRLVPFDPEADQIGETVTRILQAIQEMKS